ncbi:hypothetical protein [Streptomyces sp. ODS05-4]|uniref:hypothetical protein n=1 Tax=Streptomyces sp. ODS05-4 TaxID=2944939 RepID=UPI00210BCAFA|nr:hypothetical protein [Streptomyces sp. ODS05-4]
MDLTGGPAAPAGPPAQPRPAGFPPPRAPFAGGERPAAHAPPLPRFAPGPETPAESTVRLRPVPARRPGRTVAALACLVLGLGLTGGAAAGAWIAARPEAPPVADRWAEAGKLWHSVPVDTLFPRTLKGSGAGPGRADRSWTRIAVAPDGPCADALDPLLTRVLRPVGCARVVRATYREASASSVTTVGMVFTDGDRTGMAALRDRFAGEGLDRRADLMPRALPAPGTAAASFGDPQRASWRVSVLTDAPVVVYAVSGFADGRAVAEPQPAAEAMAPGRTTAPAQAGLGHEAKGVADRIERALRKAVNAPPREPRA